MLLHFVLFACSTPNAVTPGQSSAEIALDSITHLQQNAQQLHEDATELRNQMSFFRVQATNSGLSSTDVKAIQESVQQLRSQADILEQELQKATSSLHNGEKLR